MSAQKTLFFGGGWLPVAYIYNTCLHFVLSAERCKNILAELCASI